jgi:hypothetical protein
VTPDNRLVDRIILLAKLPGNNRRCEVARELQAHLEDLNEKARSDGYDDEASARIIRMRFGEPDEVAAAFAVVYAPERIARWILQSAILLAVSTAAVAVVIGTVQSIAAIWTATSVVSTLRDIHQELVGVGAIVAGYCGQYVGERVFPNSLGRALLLSLIVGLALDAILGWLIPRHMALPLAAYTCAACARLLQRVQMPLVWIAGTALPLLVAWWLFGPLVPGWQFPWLIGLGLIFSCKALRETVRLFEKVFVA